MRILVANANTTQSVTDTVCNEARRHAAPGTEIVGCTGRFGMGIVSTEAGNVIAGHAVLELLAEHAGTVDAAVLAISFDTALAAAQGLFPFPVIGMTSAALHTSCLMGPRFGLVTFGRSSRQIYLDLVQASGLAARMAGCITIELESAASYLDTARLDDAVLGAAASLAAAGAASVVISGAAIAGMPARLQPRAAIPLLDGIGCAVRQAELLVGLGVRSRPQAPLANQTAPSGIDPTLARLLL
jgi:allantoin racemase